MQNGLTVFPLVAVLGGCSSVGGGATGGRTAGDTSTGSEGGSTSVVGAESSSSGSASAEDTSGGPSSTSTGVATAGSSSSGGESSGTGTVEPPGDGCPERWPAEWVLCEDFEDFGGFGDFWTNNDAMAVEPGPASSGESSLRISHIVGQYGSGMADIRFGAGPEGGVIHSPDSEFREVWVRFFLRTHPHWPADRGISEGVEVMSVVGSNRSIAVDATIYSASTAEARLLPWSCVHDSELLCSSGNSDWTGTDLRPLGEAYGPTPLYGDERAGQWQCHEMHVRLDDPGQANGLVEFWAGGSLEASISDLEFVGGWTGAGLNNVRFGSFWNNQTGLDHHVDDVIVSTAPIGCPQ